jgi:CTP synthase (UTP-ammonia lyase)
MPTAIRIGIIGDFSPNSLTHPRTNDALRHGAARIGTEISITWVPTEQLASRGTSTLEHFSGIWCSPGSPYRCMEGALGGIRFAHAYPFIGT